MFEGTQELAESKLVLLYILDKIRSPISNTGLTEIVLENNLLNYFQLQQYIGELVDSSFIQIAKQGKRQLYTIHSKGKSVLGLFENRIPQSKKDIINAYFLNRTDTDKKELLISCDYNSQGGANHTVICSIKENNNTKIEIKVDAGSEEKAKKICAKWNSNASGLYSKIINILSD